MTEFVKAFDCNNEAHVMWLKSVGQAMAKSMDGVRVDVAGIVNDNPLTGKPKMKNVADWAYIHFQLAMKYTNAVLSCDAFVPKKPEVLFEGEVSRV